jgi:alkylglycerol monooxygenase
MNDQLTNNKIILLSIPLMLLIVLLERFFAHLKNKDLGPYQESVANIQCGLGQLILELPLKSFLILPYVYLLKKLSIFDLQINSITYIISFISTDFLHYWYHRLHHRIPFLWKIHSVHHQPEYFNYTVGLRLPWLHKLTVFPFYFAQAILGIPIEIFLLSVSVHAILQLWNHTELIEGKWGFINKILVTPSQHRVHHGKNQIYIDKNFAAIFSIWDVLFKTFTLETEKVEYGITNGVDPLDLIESNFGPFKMTKKIPEFIDSYRDKNLFFLSMGLSMCFGVYTLWLGTKIQSHHLIPMILMTIALMSPRYFHLKLFLFPFTMILANQL